MEGWKGGRKEIRKRQRKIERQRERKNCQNKEIQNERKSINCVTMKHFDLI